MQDLNNTNYSLELKQIQMAQLKMTKTGKRTMHIQEVKPWI